MLRKRTLVLLSLFGVATSVVGGQEQGPSQARPAAADSSAPAWGEKLHIAGIHNAGKISEVLYRGAQPKKTGLAELKKLGVTTIVDLREEDEQKIKWERQEAEELGMRFLNIPVGGWAPPSDEQVAKFLTLFRDHRQEKIFVHCRLGDDRTGVFVATYRMAVDKWSDEQAMKEMYFFGFNGFWHPAMKAFVHQFPTRLKYAPALAPFEP